MLRSSARHLLILAALLLASCRWCGEADDPVASEERIVERWLTAAGARASAGSSTRTRVSLELTWKIASDESWASYQRALLLRPPPAYPPCVQTELALACRRALAGDVFVIDVEAPDRGAHDLVARFRATSF